jgi:hypothetical protein
MVLTQLLPALGVDMTMLRWALNNRIAAFFIIVAMGSMASSLTASGAFEIYFNGAPAEWRCCGGDADNVCATAGDLIFSKLETGRWPTLLVRCGKAWKSGKAGD